MHHNILLWPKLVRQRYPEILDVQSVEPAETDMVAIAQSVVEMFGHDHISSQHLIMHIEISHHDDGIVVVTVKHERGSI